MLFSVPELTAGASATLNLPVYGIPAAGPEGQPRISHLPWQMNFLRLAYKSAMIIVGFLCLVEVARAETIILDDFSSGLSPAWKEKSFVGNTAYSLTEEDNRKCIKAVSVASASGLFYEIHFDPQKYSVISWSWKIDNVLQSGDARTRAGDDYAARVYVVFPSVFFWKTRAINYVWANKLAKGEAITSSYTKNSIMIAVESGGQAIGHWLHEKRNIAEDYRLFFGSQPPQAGDSLLAYGHHSGQFEVLEQ